MSTKEHREVSQAHVGGHTLLKSMPISLCNQISLRMLSSLSLTASSHMYSDDIFTAPIYIQHKSVDYTEGIMATQSAECFVLNTMIMQMRASKDKKK